MSNPYRYAWPRSPAEKRYHNDTKYAAMTDAIEAWIHNLDSTPSEVREMAMLACIHYEMRRLPKYIFRTGEVFPENSALRMAVYEAYDRIEALKRWMDENPIECGR